MDKAIMQPLLDLMVALRDPDKGCPWDKEQTHQTLARYCLEEAYEVVEAIDDQDVNGLRDELGDLLFQVVFHAQLASEQKQFDFQDVVDGIVQKMTRRHPHVFKDQSAITTAAQVKDQWEKIKATEKPEKTNVLSQLPRVVPSLEKAQIIGKKVAKVGFDWPSSQDVEAKVKEEWDEYQEAKAKGDLDQQEEELGDLLFAAVQWIRKEGMHAERALGRANQKFMRRFNALETELKKQDRTFEQCTSQELEKIWQNVKKRAHDASCARLLE